MPFRPESIQIHPDLQSSYESWESLADRGVQPARTVWRSLQTCLARLREDGQWGEVIRQSMIPAHFRDKYGLSNLYCVDLSAYLRCYRTIVNWKVVLLDIVDLPAYDEWFPGRRSR